jgi:hypothetical protein
VAECPWKPPCPLGVVVLGLGSKGTKVLMLCAEMTSSYGISGKVCVHEDGGRVDGRDRIPVAGVGVGVSL